MEENDLEHSEKSLRELTDRSITIAVRSHEFTKAAVKAILRDKGVAWDENTNDLSFEGKDLGKLSKWSLVGENLEVTSVLKTPIKHITLNIKI